MRGPPFKLKKINEKRKSQGSIPDLMHRHSQNFCLEEF